MFITNLNETTGFKSYDFGKRFSGLDKEISSNFPANFLGFHLEILAPGCFSSPYHYHEQEEELVIALEGEAILRQNNNFSKIKSMDLIFFPTGKDFVHQIYNHTDRSFKYFVLSSKSKEDVCHYPDSQKTLDRKNRLVTQNGVEVDYWKDELDPSIHWPEHILKGDF